MMLAGCSMNTKKGVDGGRYVYPEVEMQYLRQEANYTRSTKSEALKMGAPAIDNDNPDRPLDRERYAARDENAFKDVRIYPTSVFSVDVDNASYSNVRRFINQGQLPPAGSVRVEEMINYFKYDYPAPKGSEPVALNAEIGACPWNNAHYLIRLGLKSA